jgi:hypothetical protein
MRGGPALFRRMRGPVAPVLLGVFALAAQLAPALHVATHRPDHSHGAEVVLALVHHDDHEAAHRAGRPHHHGRNSDADASASGESRAGVAHSPGRASASARDEAASPGEAEAPAGTPAAPPAHDHGLGSAAHFGLALLDPPPPPFVARPAEAVQPLVAFQVPRVSLTPRPRPPVRGPPATS